MQNIFLAETNIIKNHNEQELLSTPEKKIVKDAVTKMFQDEGSKTDEKDENSDTKRSNDDSDAENDQEDLVEDSEDTNGTSESDDEEGDGNDSESSDGNDDVSDEQDESNSSEDSSQEDETESPRRVPIILKKKCKLSVNPADSTKEKRGAKVVYKRRKPIIAVDAIRLQEQCLVRKYTTDRVFRGVKFVNTRKMMRQIMGKVSQHFQLNDNNKIAWELAFEKEVRYAINNKRNSVSQDIKKVILGKFTN